MSDARRRFGAVRALLLLLLVGAGAVLWGWHDFTAPGPLPAAKTIVLPRGEGVPALARLLADNGVIAHPWVFVAGLLATGQFHALKAGEYEFLPALSPAGVADLLASGRVVQHRLTVPEGLTSAEIVALLKATPALSGEIAQTPAEGSLLPETYFFVLGDRREELLQRMHQAMAKALAEAWAKRSPELLLTRPEEAVILASIVEKETAKPEERPRVAGVYINRLRLGMKLQADPTVLYALGETGATMLGHPLDHEDLSLDSPYNTYVYKGLPPTPIANPGRASLLAAVRPAVTEDLYFVGDGLGGHRFSRTLDEHNRNVSALRRQQGGN